MCFLGYSPENIYFCNVRKGVLLYLGGQILRFQARFSKGKPYFCIT